MNTVKGLLFFLTLCSLLGCSPRAYRKVPHALGLPYAERTVTDTTVTISRDGHTFVFNRGKREMLVDGICYYLNKPAGMNSVNKIDTRLLRAAIVSPVQQKAQLTVMLDPGHGGTDTGCRVGDVYEKTINLNIARQVKSLLEAKGHRVILTRDSDQKTLTLDDRTTLSATHTIDAFVSIHVNSAANPNAKGVEVFTLPAYGCEGTVANSPARGPLVGQAYLVDATRLALAIQREMVDMPSSPVDRGVRRAHFKVLRDTPAPAVLIETGFLSNKDDYALLTSAQGQTDLAGAIAAGIEHAFGN